MAAVFSALTERRYEPKGHLKPVCAMNASNFDDHATRGLRTRSLVVRSSGLPSLTTVRKLEACATGSSVSTYPTSCTGLVARGAVIVSWTQTIFAEELR